MGEAREDEEIIKGPFHRAHTTKLWIVKRQSSDTGLSMELLVSRYFGLYLDNSAECLTEVQSSIEASVFFFFHENS